MKKLTSGTKVQITKGDLKGLKAIITNAQKEEIGAGFIYELKTESGEKVWNGDFSFWSESFVKMIKE